MMMTMHRRQRRLEPEDETTMSRIWQSMSSEVDERSPRMESIDLSLAQEILIVIELDQ